MTPTHCSEALRPYLARMAADLRRNRLDVVTAPAPVGKHAGHAVRVVQGENPEWYQKLCARHPSARKDLDKWRKFKTRVKRFYILQALDALAANGETRSTYARELIAEAAVWMACDP